MKKIFFAFAFLLFVAPHAFASTACGVESVVVHPEPLYSDEAGQVWVRGGCASGPHPPALIVDYDGFDIDAIIDSDGSGPLVPVSWGDRFQLPQLRAGRYTIRFINENEVVETHQFDVLERPFNVTPSFGSRGKEVIITGLPLFDCVGACSPTRVFFGSVEATIANVEIAGGMVVIVPQNATSGDIRVQFGDNTSVLFEDAFRFSNDAPDQWDRVLFPVNFTGRGAHASDWHTDIVVRNDAPVTVDTRPLFGPDPASPTLPVALPLAPGVKGNFPEEPRDGGAFLYVPRGLESSFTYASHAVDRSRSATDLGTEMPVVRAEDTGKAIRFLELPVDSRYRAKMRVYDFDGTNQHSVLVTIRKPGSNDVLAYRDLALTGAPTCAGVDPCFPDRPSFAYLDLEQLPQLRGVDVVDVWLSARRNDARLWAFVSITNNETQSVTLYTPQHKPAK